MANLKVSQQKINEIAKKIAEVNTALWNVACLTEELMKDEVVSEIYNQMDEYKTLFKKIAKAYTLVDKQDEDFVQIEMRSRNLQDFDYFTNRISEFLEEN